MNRERKGGLTVPEPASQRDPSRDGFTIIEVVVAVVVLAVGVLGLAGTTAYIVREVTLANMMTERSVAFQSVVERLQATPFADVAAGSDSIGPFGMTWSPVDESSQSKLVTIVTSGPGVGTSAGTTFPILRSNVADTFEYRVIKQ